MPFLSPIATHVRSLLFRHQFVLIELVLLACRDMELHQPRQKRQEYTYLYYLPEFITCPEQRLAAPVNRSLPLKQQEPPFSYGKLAKSQVTQLLPMYIDRCHQANDSCVFGSTLILLPNLTFHQKK
jgi:hypothetical protein